MQYFVFHQTTDCIEFSFIIIKLKETQNQLFIREFISKFKILHSTVKHTKIAIHKRLAYVVKKLASFVGWRMAIHLPENNNNNNNKKT